jgi:hypothetical protein
MKYDLSDDLGTKSYHKEPKIQPNDFYLENGKMVMTEHYHKKRGVCCGGGCRHCPYQPKHIKNNQQLS